LIASFPVILFVDPYVSHWNVIWFPLIYFAARGIYVCVVKKNWMKAVSIGMIVIVFLGFARKYITFFGRAETYKYPYTGFLYGYDQCIDFVKEKHFNKIYSRQAYPHALFCAPIDVYEYNRTKTDHTFANYDSTLPDSIIALPHTAYIITNFEYDFDKIDMRKFHVERYGSFTLLWND
jgi:hypothetical protein